jgi:hypothetical protein
VIGEVAVAFAAREVVKAKAVDADPGPFVIERVDAGSDGERVRHRFEAGSCTSSSVGCVDML